MENNTIKPIVDRKGKVHISNGYRHFDMETACYIYNCLCNNPVTGKNILTFNPKILCKKCHVEALIRGH